MTRRVRVTAAEARRIALAAQGFDRARPVNPTDIRHFRRAMAAIAVLQLDFVNVLIPAHFLMIWSRLGPYDRKRFEKFLYDSGEHTEQWAHEASIVASLWRLNGGVRALRSAATCIRLVVNRCLCGIAMRMKLSSTAARN